MAASESLLKHDHPVVVNEKAAKKPPKVGLILLNLFVYVISV